VLGFVARRLAAESVGLVFAARVPTSEVAGLPQLSVQGLAPADARALLDTEVAVPLNGWVRDQLVAETHGNPLALLEWPRALTTQQWAGGFGLPAAVWILPTWIGIGFIFQSVAETVLAINYNALPERGWHIFTGVLTTVAGMVVVGLPIDSIVVLAIVAGAWLVVIGTAQIVWALKARKATAKLEPVIDPMKAKRRRLIRRTPRKDSRGTLAHRALDGAPPAQRRGCLSYRVLLQHVSAIRLSAVRSSRCTEAPVGHRQ
jgi:hypothetical protein